MTDQPGPCGCEVQNFERAGMAVSAHGHYILYCPLHRYAGEMREGLGHIVQTVGNGASEITLANSLLGRIRTTALSLLDKIDRE